MKNHTLRKWVLFFFVFSLIVTTFSFVPNTQAASVTGKDVASYAKSLIGKSYKKNSNGPDYFDNTGLTQYIYQQFGVTLGHSLSEQSKIGKLITNPYAVQAGDLLFFSYKSSNINAVALYLGNDQMIAVTPSTGKVKVLKASSYIKYFEGARRLTDLLNTPVEQPVLTDRDQLANQVVAVAKQYLGVPYKLGARYDLDGSYKFDCSSYVQYVFNKVGIKLPRTATQQQNATKRIADKDLQVGDLVFFDTDLSGGMNHVGIYLGDGNFIHASTAKDGGVQISNMWTSSYWKKVYMYAHRVF